MEQYLRLALLVVLLGFLLRKSRVLGGRPGVLLVQALLQEDRERTGNTRTGTGPGLLRSSGSAARSPTTRVPSATETPRSRAKPGAGPRAAQPSAPPADSGVPSHDSDAPSVSPPICQTRSGRGITLTPDSFSAALMSGPLVTVSALVGGRNLSVIDIAPEQPEEQGRPETWHYESAQQPDGKLAYFKVLYRKDRSPVPVFWDYDDPPPSCRDPRGKA